MLKSRGDKYIDNIRLFDSESGVEYEVHEGSDELALAEKISNNEKEICDSAISYTREFFTKAGNFELDSVLVKNCELYSSDFTMRFHFESDDGEEFVYVEFDNHMMKKERIGIYKCIALTIRVS